MDMDMISKIVEAQRKERFESNEQLSLWEFIKKLKVCIDTGKDDKNVVFDFEYLFPTGLNSWRGSYEELALNFGSNEDENEMQLELTEFIKLCEEAIGKTYTGWKGGDFVMSEDTPLWVANMSNSGNTAVVDVLDEGWQVVIITKYMEF